MAFTFTPYQKKEYQQSQNVTNAQNALQQHQQNKPGEYKSQWQNQIDDLLSQYQNRGQFQYDINSDAMYQQLVDRYVQQGKQAMMDTMGQAAALTGGYGNSYAQSVGQQTYQGYLQGANDMMPQFYQMALDRYQMEGDQLMNQYGLLTDQEDRAYGQYMDLLNQYNAQLDRLQGVYESERDFDYGKFQYDQNFDYNAYMDDQDYKYKADRDATADSQWQQQMAFQQEQARLEAERWQREFEESVRQYNESMAWQREKASMDLAAAQAAAAAKAAKSVVSYSGGGGSGYTRGSSTGIENRYGGSYVKHDDMLKEVNQLRTDALNTGYTLDEANKMANLLAGSWYQQYGKYK